jgi:hypothetical protein
VAKGTDPVDPGVCLPKRGSGSLPLIAFRRHTNAIVAIIILGLR